MDYVFYFDESFHDRKIVLSQKGTINVLREDGIDDYIGIFWGCEQKRQNEYKKMLEGFENKYRAVFSLPEGKELKSEIIGKKNFQYGIHSFNKNAFWFYYDLFSLLSNWDFIIQINIISKIELFIRNSLKSVVLPQIANKNGLIYSLTKLLVVHRPVQLITAMNDVANGADGSLFWKELSKTLNAYSEASEGAARKTQTIVAFREIVQIIKQINYNPSIESKTDFQYYPNFEGLCNLLQELDIDPQKIKITVDTEEKTIAAARKY